MDRYIIFFHLDYIGINATKVLIVLIIKGQPQQEVKGGQIHLTLAQTATDSLYLWAKKSNLLKSGEVLFQTDLGMTVLRINFTDAYCVSLTREIGAMSGTKTTMLISPDSISMNGTTHDNAWV